MPIVLPHELVESFIRMGLWPADHDAKVQEPNPNYGMLCRFDFDKGQTCIMRGVLEACLEEH